MTLATTPFPLTQKYFLIATKVMSMALVNAVRKLGWPDSNGHWQYGNAAILCYLSRYNNAGKEIVERYKDVRVSDLVSKYT